MILNVLLNDLRRNAIYVSMRQTEYTGVDPDHYQNDLAECEYPSPAAVLSNWPI
jgi:hypothetical protein